MAIESYNGAVLDAVHDEADQISSIKSIERQQREQTQAQSAAESAYDLATQRYRAGLGTYLTVLNAESTVLAQRRQAADLKGPCARQPDRIDPRAWRGYAGDAELATRTAAGAQ